MSRTIFRHATIQGKSMMMQPACDHRSSEATGKQLQHLSLKIMSPKANTSVDPVLRIGEQSWDLTNLFPRGRVPQHQTICQEKNRSTCRPRRATTLQSSLYPDLSQLDESIFQLEPASEVFRKTAAPSLSPPPTSRPGAFCSTPNGSSSSFTRSPQRPGAFHSNSTSRPKPPLPSWVMDSPDNLQRKIKANSVDDDSNMPPFPQRRRSSRPHVDIYRQESILSMQSTGSTLSTNPISRTEEEDESFTSPPPRRSRIEVSPGHYLPLRGSAETLAAVESGMARAVQCVACSATLLCVPDAELVICPDCRLLSPLATSKQAYGSSAQQPGVQYNVGGVGLGLKVESQRTTT